MFDATYAYWEKMQASRTECVIKRVSLLFQQGSLQSNHHHGWLCYMHGVKQLSARLQKWN